MLVRISQRPPQRLRPEAKEETGRLDERHPAGEGAERITNKHGQGRQGRKRPGRPGPHPWLRLLSGRAAGPPPAGRARPPRRRAAASPPAARASHRRRRAGKGGGRAPGARRQERRGQGRAGNRRGKLSRRRPSGRRTGRQDFATGAHGTPRGWVGLAIIVPQPRAPGDAQAAIIPPVARFLQQAIRWPAAGAGVLPRIAGLKIKKDKNTIRFIWKFLPVQGCCPGVVLPWTRACSRPAGGSARSGRAHGKHHKRGAS